MIDTSEIFQLYYEPALNDMGGRCSCDVSKDIYDGDDYRSRPSVITSCPNVSTKLVQITIPDEGRILERCVCDRCFKYMVASKKRDQNVNNCVAV